jgi:hypothetical protein
MTAMLWFITGEISGDLILPKGVTQLPSFREQVCVTHVPSGL